MSVIKIGLIIFGLIILISTLYAFGPGGRERLENIFSVPTPLPEIDFQGLELHDRPNQFLVCPDGLCSAAVPHLKSPAFDIPAEQLFSQFQSMALNQQDVKRLKYHEADLKADFVQRTKTMRYPDIVTVQAIPFDENSSTLAIYSRSVFGHSDFGVNEKRIRHWLNELSNSD